MYFLFFFKQVFTITCIVDHEETPPKTTTVHLSRKRLTYSPDNGCLCTQPHSCSGNDSQAH